MCSQIHTFPSILSSTQTGIDTYVCTYPPVLTFDPRERYGELYFILTRLLPIQWHLVPVRSTASNTHISHIHTHVSHIHTHTVCTHNHEHTCVEHTTYMYVLQQIHFAQSVWMNESLKGYEIFFMGWILLCQGKILLLVAWNALVTIQHGMADKGGWERPCRRWRRGRWVLWSGRRRRKVWGDSPADTGPPVPAVLTDGPPPTPGGRQWDRIMYTCKPNSDPQTQWYVCTIPRQFGLRRDRDTPGKDIGPNLWSQRFWQNLLTATA